MFGRTLPTVARESDPAPLRFSAEPAFKPAEPRPPMFGDRRRFPAPRLEGARRLPMFGIERTEPSEGDLRPPRPPIDGECRLPMLGADRMPPIPPKLDGPPQCPPAPPSPRTWRALKPPMWPPLKPPMSPPPKPPPCPPPEPPPP